MKPFVTVAILMLSVLISGPAAAKQLFTYEGVLNLQDGRLDMNVSVESEETLRLSLRKKDDRQFHFKGDLAHFQALAFDMNSEMEGLIEVQRNERGRVDAVVGTLWSNYSIIDGKPVKEMSGGFRVEGGQLQVSELHYGAVGVNGAMDLSAPYKMDFNFSMNYMPMAAFLKFWTGHDHFENARGDVVGTIRALGPLDRVLLKGNLKSFDTVIKGNEFDSIVLNLEGYYPDFEIDKSSRLAKQGGVSFSIDGRIDLGDLRSFKRQLKELHTAPLVKESESLKEWTIKTQQETGTESAALEYFIRNEDKLGTTDDEEDIMFGIQRSVQF